MITPRLHRRALAAALQWRLLFLFWLAGLLPAAVGIAPVQGFLAGALDQSPRAAQSIARLDGATLVELLRRLRDGERLDALLAGLAGALALALVLAPFVAAAMVAAARERQRLRFDRLLAGAGELYGRLVRSALVAVLPLGLAAAGGAFALHAADGYASRAVRETDASRAAALAWALGAVLLFLGHLVADGARALFAAEPGRRSALVALCGALRLFARRPARFLSLGVLTTALALGPMLLILAARPRIGQGTGAGQLAAWALGQLVPLFVGWGRAARFFGLAELARADAADRSRSGTFRREAPATSPPPPLVESATLGALAPPPPPSSGALSGPDGSGT